MLRFSIVCVALLIAVAGCTKSDPSGTDANVDNVNTVSIKVEGMT